MWLLQNLGHNQFFYITNTMHDETQLWMTKPSGERGRGGQKKRRRVLGASGQVTHGDRDGVKEDVDVFRAPRILEDYTARNCASVVARPDDAAGLLPTGDALPPAAFFGSLMSSDSHDVNKLLSKLIVAEQKGLPGAGFRCHLPSYCCQHKVGSFIEAVTKYLGVHSPSFCIASLLCFQDISTELAKRVDKIFDEELEVSSPIGCFSAGHRWGMPGCEIYHGQVLCPRSQPSTT